MLSKENKSLTIRYIIISIISYGFVFSGLIFLVSVMQVDKTFAFIIIYGINYIFLYMVQLKYLFKTNHKPIKLFKFIVFILSFFLLANILYNLGLKLNINYIVSTGLTIVILMPLRIVVSKLIVFKD